MTEEQESNTPSISSEVVIIPPSLRTFIERYGISPLLFGVLVLIIVFVLYQIFGGLITLLLFGLKPTPENVNGFRIATGVAQICLLLIPTLFLVRFASLTPYDFMRIRRADPRLFLFPLVGIFSLQQVLQIYLTFQERIPLPESIQKINDQFKELFEQAYKLLVSSHSIPELLFVILVVALIPAVAEETLFRGLVQGSFEEGLTPMKGVILTGVIFGAYHLNPFSFIPLAVLGIYLGFIVLKANSLWVSVAAHFYNNLFACLATYFHYGDNDIVLGDPQKMSTGMLLLGFWFFGLVFLVSTYYFVHVCQRIPPATGRHA